VKKCMSLSAWTQVDSAPLAGKKSCSPHPSWSASSVKLTVFDSCPLLASRQESQASLGTMGSQMGAGKDLETQGCASAYVPVGVRSLMEKCLVRNDRSWCQQGRGSE
jgi:hypothetical protein